MPQDKIGSTDATDQTACDTLDPADKPQGVALMVWTIIKIVRNSVALEQREL